MTNSSEALEENELHKVQEKLLREKDIKREEERLKEQQRWLATKRLMLHGQYSDWLNGTIVSRTIIPYCKTWNQNLAAQLQDRLPREVRDMIYKHLWHYDPDRTSPHLMARQHVKQHYTFTCPYCPPDTIAMFPRLLDIAQSMYRAEDGDLKQMFDQSTLPHYLSPDYVGVLTAHEIGVSFYQSLNEENLLQCQSSRIGSVLQNDSFHLGLPTMELIRSLTVHCNVDRYRTPPPNHSLSSKCRHSLNETALVRSDLLIKDFCSLLEIKKKKGFNLHIIMYQRYIRLNVLEEAIEVLQPMLKSLVQDGSSLTMSWTYRGHWDNLMGPPCYQLVSCDITSALEAPNDPLLDDPEWKWDLYEVLDQAEDIILPEHAKFEVEPVNNLKASNRSAINRFMHNMYDLSEMHNLISMNVITPLGTDVPSESEADSDASDGCKFGLCDHDDDEEL
ncbi:hypothetical protein COCC4DRAFT_27172 [Bipolaris maydis ATCC 48331]|uniref:Uncharacterized protein n=2 Tax=Cochliobolus heterostrophus TaxID=5016 RepID=M2TCC6_COCH5|nr:uncharacterized protein COCC4DRAFT_27172 [Bipolaris maydis ATCC 48331]EMD95190.1 hypothetical protein COCHEDRAFT_23091 [Bipolaris maydis C5]KAJ5021821.1 hypothetical protein J3E73DRAFT_261577 [Bipolaris maydis]ENI00918.1 hypothetical protein COCC4DRAFT_27172 [Bipolaris maydis ATCC 48331]KAJ6202868.1 hypothetical protein J3E72DRAFT_264463 [Bipolaris maydis]KAJ6214211.1 hypothetical protein PSV09DRAFT_23091 [Bipolaris maydis]